MSNSSNSDDDKYEIRNTVNNEDLEDNLKIFENKIQNNIKLQTHLNAQILRNQSVVFKMTLLGLSLALFIALSFASINTSSCFASAAI